MATVAVAVAPFSLIASVILAGIEILGSTLESGEMGSMGFRPRVTLADAAAIAAAAAAAISATERPWLAAATPDKSDRCSPPTDADASGRHFSSLGLRLSFVARFVCRRRGRSTRFERRFTVARVVGISALRQNLGLFDPLLAVDPAGNSQLLSDPLDVG